MTAYMVIRVHNLLMKGLNHLLSQPHIPVLHNPQKLQNLLLTRSRLLLLSRLHPAVSILLLLLLPPPKVPNAPTDHFFEFFSRNFGSCQFSQIEENLVGEDVGVVTDVLGYLV